MLKSVAKQGLKKTTKTSKPQRSNLKTIKSASKKVTKTPKRTFLKSLVGVSNEQKVPLDIVHPSITLPSPSEAVTTIPPPQISTLSNGIKVITMKSMLPISHITLSINAGSRFEITNDGVNGSEHSEAGLTHFMERAILRSTNRRVTPVLHRDMAKLGADLEASTGRETFTISASTPTRINPVLGALADIVKNAEYDLVDVSIDAHNYEFEANQRDQDIDSKLDEALHLAAFGPTPIVDENAKNAPHFGLGSALYMNHKQLHHLTPTTLKNFHKKFFVANRITIGAVGVEHDSFVQLAEEMFGDIQQGTPETEGTIPVARTNYVANQLHLHTPTSEPTESTNVVLAWNAPALLSQHLAAATVLRSVLGGGASFSAGGPGKGMYSRLYRNLLQGHDFVQSIDSFYTTYTDAGLLGIAGVVPNGHAGEFTQTVLDEMRSLPDSLTQDEVDRAKNQLKTSLSEHISEGLELCEEMTRNVQIFGKYHLPTFIQQVENVTLADVKTIATKILEHEITVVTHGDASDLPRDIAM